MKDILLHLSYTFENLIKTIFLKDLEDTLLLTITKKI